MRAFSAPCAFPGVWRADCGAGSGQAKAYASQYGANTNVADDTWGGGAGTTPGGAEGGDVTGRPLWGGPVSADRGAGGAAGGLMAVGDFSYDNRGAVFLTRRQPDADYMSYMEAYQYSPMPLPSWID